MKTILKRSMLPVIAAISLGLSACGAEEIVLWPFVEATEEAPRDPSTLPPPPLEPIDPLDPDAQSDPSEVVSNPNANTGAPEAGTPFTDGQPVNEAIPISDEISTPISTDTGEPITVPDVDAPASSSTGPDSTPESNTPAVAAPAFFFYGPGSLEPSSGTGSPDLSVFVADMAFPIREAEAHPQSQVYRYGGGVKGGDQCDARNFTTPWRDNYCESRSTTSATPYCPKAGVHLGQDIRVGTREGCLAERSTPASQRERYPVIAVEDGYISNVGSYSVNLRGDGRIYRYLHLNMSKLAVAMGQQVKKGDLIGYVSNDFGGTPTTLHLHFEIKVNTAEHGWQYVPPYSSLLAAYQRRENNPGEEVSANVAVASTP